MSARSEARAADAIFRDPARPFALGDRVRCAAGIGYIEFIAHSHAMNSPVFTVALDTRTKLRLLGRDIAHL